MSQGKKDDAGKPRFDLVDPDFLLSVAKVLTFGAVKYGAYNWTGVDQERIVAAAHRHLNAIQRGETIDPETGEPHASHLACCSMFLHYKV